MPVKLGSPASTRCEVAVTLAGFLPAVPDLRKRAAVGHHPLPPSPRVPAEDVLTQIRSAKIPWDPGRVRRDASLHRGYLMTRSSVTSCFGLLCILALATKALGRPIEWFDGNQRLALHHGYARANPTTGEDPESLLPTTN